MTLVGEILFFSVPHSNSLDPSRTLEGLFGADTATFNGPLIASCIASGTTDIQGHWQVFQAKHGGIPGRKTFVSPMMGC